MSTPLERTVPCGCGFKLFHATPMSFELNTASDRDFLEPCNLLKLWPWRCLDTEQCTKFYIYLPIALCTYTVCRTVIHTIFCQIFRHCFLRFEKLLDICNTLQYFKLGWSFKWTQTIKTWCNIGKIIINNCNSKIRKTE